MNGTCHHSRGWARRAHAVACPRPVRGAGVGARGARKVPTPRDESRAITWMPKGLELLDRLEIGDDFARAGVRRVAHEFWAGGRRLLTMRFDKVRSPHRYTLQLPQHETPRH